MYAVCLCCAFAHKESSAFTIYWKIEYTDKAYKKPYMAYIDINSFVRHIIMIPKMIASMNTMKSGRELNGLIHFYEHYAILFIKIYILPIACHFSFFFFLTSFATSKGFTKKENWTKFFTSLWTTNPVQTFSFQF